MCVCGFKVSYMKCWEKSSKISQVLLSSRAVTPGDPSSAIFTWVLRTGSQQLRPTSISELVKQVAVVLSNQNVKKKLHVLSKNLKGIIKLQFTDSNSTPSMILLLAGSLLLLQI